MSEATSADKKLTVIEQFHASAGDRRRAAAERYRELLLRNDAPKAGDAEKLVAEMATLGRAPAELECDLELVQELAACEHAEKTLRELQGPLAEARRKLTELQRRHDAERKKLQNRQASQMASAEAELVKVQAAVSAATSLDAVTVRDRWTALVEGVSAQEVRLKRRRERLLLPPAERTREEVFAECHAAIRDKRNPPDMTAVAWVTFELDRAKHSPLTGVELGELRQVGRPSRDEVIATIRHRTVEQRIWPVDASAAGVVAMVNAELELAGWPPLDVDEVKQHSVDTWLPQRSR